MEYEKCYVYDPSQNQPAKRRRTEAQGLQASWRLRRKAFDEAWLVQQKKISAGVQAINATTVQSINDFLEQSAAVANHEVIPTGFVVTGPNPAFHTSIIRQLPTGMKPSIQRTSLLVSPSNVTNLKALLKFIIQRITAREEGMDEEDDADEPKTQKKAPKLLNYDLKILADFVREHRLEQVVLEFPETEAIDSHLLSELIELLACWVDRIPLVLLLGVATSVDFLQQRLSKRAIKCLDGREFDCVPAAEGVEQVFTMFTDGSAPMWIGSNLMASILERQSDNLQGINSFTDATQYTFMTTFYANALSIFLKPGIQYDAIPADHFEALRNLSSFKTFCQQLLIKNQYTRLRHLLDSDEILFGLVSSEIGFGRQALKEMMKALEVIRHIHQILTPSQVPSRSKLYLQAMSNKLAGSTSLRSLLLTIRKSPSDVAQSIIDTLTSLELPELLSPGLRSIQSELSTLLAAHSAHPLRSEDDTHNSSLRTTVVAQKVELSKQKATLSKQDESYTNLLRRFTDLLESYFASAIIDPRALVFHEIFIYDLKSPHREVFTPRPRHAIERALAAPHDYLDCACCAPERSAGGEDGLEGDDEATLAGTQPATAILYQLYLESGSLINVRDLLSAFEAVIGGGDSKDEGEEAGKQTLALFQRALAELRYLGMLKVTRKRIDHVAKVAWRGL